MEYSLCRKLWIFVALLVYILISNSRNHKSSIEIFNRRFAKGEISRGEYMMLKREIIAKDVKTKAEEKERSS
ncbi:hypothetical protein IPdc08_01746 [archaeon]|nr:hypothetical protein IPdc08_01746 [archaeon]